MNQLQPVCQLGEKLQNSLLERLQKSQLQNIELQKELEQVRKRFDERMATPNEHEKFLIKQPLQSEIDRLRKALEGVLDTQTMLTAVHAMDESYEICRRALNKGGGVDEICTSLHRH